MMALLYNLLLVAALPLLLPYLLYRIALRGKSREGWAERLGWVPRRPPAPPEGRVWLHAVSAGEMVAAAAIARRLAEVAPGAELVVSTTTPAGRQQAERLIPDAAAIFYFPLDLLPCMLLALRRLRPTAVAAVETEIWPNWLWLARRMGIRTALVNGQLADRGYRRARRAPWLYGWALQQLDALWMQTAEAAARAESLGATRTSHGARPSPLGAPGAAPRLRVVGNAKFEQPLPPAGGGEAAEVVCRALGCAAAVGEPEDGAAQGGRRLWIAGSTHPGEEEQLLAAFARLRTRFPDLALLLAPRHRERAAEVERLARAAGWRVARRSEPPAGGAPLDLLILDTMGELAGLYALADVVFVGGSLVPVGGHDILQPLFAGRPTLFGPHMQNQRDLAALALAEGAAVQVADAEALARETAALLEDGACAARLRRAGAALLERNRGAALEYARLLAALAAGRTPGAEPDLRAAEPRAPGCTDAAGPNGPARRGAGAGWSPEGSPAEVCR